jgi:hypothetical protein
MDKENNKENNINKNLSKREIDNLISSESIDKLIERKRKYKMVVDVKSNFDKDINFNMFFDMKREMRDKLSDLIKNIDLNLKFIYDTKKRMSNGLIIINLDLSKKEDLAKDIAIKMINLDIGSMNYERMKLRLDMELLELSILKTKKKLIDTIYKKFNKDSFNQELELLDQRKCVNNLIIMLDDMKINKKDLDLDIDYKYGNIEMDKSDNKDGIDFNFILQNKKNIDDFIGKYCNFKLEEYCIIEQ